MEPSNNVPDSILERIQKLMAIKEGSGASQNEIEEAAKMATALLMKYNLSMSEVSGHKGETKGKMEHDKFSMQGKTTRHEAGWLQDLYHVIAKYNMCKAIKSHPNEKQDKDDMGYVWLVGKRHNVEIVHYLVDSLTHKIRTACATAFKTYDGDEKRNTFRRGFFRGAVVGIGIKLKEQAEELKMDGATNNEMGLMVVSNAQAIKLYVQQLMGGTSASKAHNLMSKNGYTQGVEEGRKMTTNAALGNGNINKRLN